MKVACNLLWLVPGEVGGTETATVALLRQLAAEPPDDIELSLYALDGFGQAYPDVVEAYPTVLAHLSGRLRPLRVAAENSWLARQTQHRVDLVHHMGGVLPAVQGAPGAVTLHDLQPFDMPQNFVAAKRAYLQRSIPRSVRRAAVVITPTEFVRHGIIDRFGVAPERVHRAPWGVEAPRSDVSVAEVQARYGLPRRWFVYPSFTWNHKNHDLLLRAFSAVVSREHDTMLVLTGGEGPAEEAVVEQINRIGLSGRVRRTGLIPRRDVLAIVRGAVAMTFPSRYEGFGLPVLEAMSVGTPVLAADTAALPEVVGGAGTLISPDDAEAWALAMLGMLDDGDERRRLAAAGRARVAGFTWRRSAADTLAAYRSTGVAASTPPVAVPTPDPVTRALATPDGATPDGAVPDGAVPDGAVPDGADAGDATPEADAPLTDDGARTDGAPS